MKVWLDDKRPAPRGWTWTKTVDETTRLLRSGRVTELSLDFDLHKTDPGHDGAEVLEWLRTAGVKPPVLHAHTANPWGGARLAYLRRVLEGRAAATPNGHHDMYMARGGSEAANSVKRRLMR